MLIVVDTLRADHLTRSGAERHLTPNFEKFASESVVFDEASSQASCTFPSMNSLLTSRYPGVFLAQSAGDFAIPKEMPTLASILGQEGYSTYAVSASPIVRKTPSRFNETGGFDVGFDGFDERCHWRAGSCVNDSVGEWLVKAEQPYFLYVHYLDPHALYDPPANFPRRYSNPYSGDKEFVRKGDPRPIEKMIYDEGPDIGLTQGDLAHLRDLYAEEVAYTDAAFGALIQMFASLRHLKNSIVVLAADHGEDFLEQGDVHHCHSLYQTSIHTPLMIRLPGAAATGRFSHAVQNLDVVPTLLDYLGVELGQYELAGRSLRPLIEGRVPSISQPVSYAYASQGVLRSVRDDRFKLIFDSEAERARLYDLESDPDEREDSSVTHPEVLQRLRGALESWTREFDPAPEAGKATNQGRGLEERLRVLGYIE